MRSVLRAIGVLAIAIVAVLALSRWATPPLESRQTFVSDGFCIDITHAGRLLDGAPYTNSLEALNQNYKSGRHIFEFDLALTANSHIVLAHDWDAYGGMPPDRATFLADGSLTRLDLAQFVNWVGRTCTDCRIVTDTKFAFEQFWEPYTGAVPAEMQRDQFILQTYDFATAQALAARAGSSADSNALSVEDSL